MKILWLAQKDVDHPDAAGAEAADHDLLKRLAHDGHHVILISSGYAGAKSQEMKEGYRVVRVGNRSNIFFTALAYCREKLAGWPDVVVEQVDGVPFFAERVFSGQTVLFVRQLWREMWFYQAVFPLSLLGYLLEPLLMRRLRASRVITLSQSTKAELIEQGFGADQISVIADGISLEPVADLDGTPKFVHSTLLCFGLSRESKRVDHIVKAFLIAKHQLSELRLIIVGEAHTRHARYVRRIVESSGFQSAVTFTGQISEEEKTSLLRKAHLLVMASVKEGFGIAVTEANSQGTPAVAYAVSGLTDSILHGKTGLLVADDEPAELANAVLLLLQDPEEYERIRREAYAWSRNFSFNAGYQGLLDALQAHHNAPRDFVAAQEKSPSGVSLELAGHLPQGSWGDRLDTPSPHEPLPPHTSPRPLLFRSGWRSFRSPSFFRRAPKARPVTPLLKGTRRSQPIRIASPVSPGSAPSERLQNGSL